MRKLLQTLMCCAIAASAPAAFAVALVPDVLTPLPGTTAAAEPQLAGVVLEDETTAFSFFDGTGIHSGTVQSRVVRSDLDGTLDFYWRVVSSPGESGNLGSLRVSGFFAPEYNANYRVDGLGNVAPVAARRFDGADAGSVNFLFTADSGANNFTPGSESNFMFLDTSATFYRKTGSFDLTGTGAGNISLSYATFAPAIPEPATYAMFGVGLLTLGLLRRRRS